MTRVRQTNGFANNPKSTTWFTINNISWTVLVTFGILYTIALFPISIPILHLSGQLEEITKDFNDFVFVDGGEAVVRNSRERSSSVFMFWFVYLNPEYLSIFLPDNSSFSGFLHRLGFSIYLS